MSEPDPKADTSPDPSKDDSSDLPANVEELSEEEQMALYEKSLKNDDWGHQPC